MPQQEQRISFCTYSRPDVAFRIEREERREYYCRMRMHDWLRSCVSDRSSDVRSWGRISRRGSACRENSKRGAVAVCTTG